MPAAGVHTGRSNGLSPTAPNPDQTLLVAGGGGYIGCVLVPRLLDRGYRVRVLDRLYFGEETLAGFRDRIELVVGDIREPPASAFEDIDGIINLAGLSNDPTAEYDPEANWQMNAIGTETLAERALEHGVGRYVFASSCSLYDGLPPGMHDERAEVNPQGAYTTSKRYGEEALLRLVEHGLTPVILRNATVYGWSPRMRFDLVVNTFLKDALLGNTLTLHGGGWMWRPLVDVRDVADATIAAYEAPAEQVRGEIFNVLHSNYQIRELAMIVAGMVGLQRRPVEVVDAPAPRLTRDYEASNAKLSRVLGFVPRRSVLDAATDLLERFGDTDKVELTHPRHYNIRWLELMSEISTSLEPFQKVL